MSALHHVIQTAMIVSNPFDTAGTKDADQIGFASICAGLICAIDVLLLSVALATRRRPPREYRYYR